MKNLLKIGFILSACMINALISAAQEESHNDPEAYSKAHIAFTNFKLLGISESEYAKCVESVNYQEPLKRHKLVIIGEEIFVDDGQHYDLKANDGILTSTSLSKYAEAVAPVEPGKYRSVKQNVIFFAESFVHSKNPEIAGKFSIECNIVWMSCSQMTGAYQILCKIIGWPWGVFVLKDCKVAWS